MASGIYESGPTYYANMVMQPLAQTYPAAASVVPYGYASDSAVQAITAHPELVIGYYNHMFNRYNMAGSRDRSDEKVIISSGDTKLLAW